MQIKGAVGSSATVHSDYVVIKQPLEKPFELKYSEIIAIDFQLPTLRENGFIYFRKSGDISVDSFKQVVNIQNALSLRAFSKKSADEMQAAYDHVRAQWQAFQSTYTPPEVPPIPMEKGGPEAFVADELLRLKGLLDAGIISRAEFDEHKAKVLL